MGIFNLNEGDGPDLSTVEGRKEKSRELLLEVSNRTMKSLVVGFSQGLRQVWQNPLDLTPQQVFDSLGTQAAEFVRLAHQTRDFINCQVPGTFGSEDPLPLILHEDGTVTVDSEFRGAEVKSVQSK